MRKAACVKFGSVFLPFNFFFFVLRFCMEIYALIHFFIIINGVVGSPTKMAAALGMCLVFRTVVSSYRSNNTHLKYSKWKEKALKSYCDQKALLFYFRISKLCLRNTLHAEIYALILRRRHSLSVMQNIPYGLFSMQQGSFELSDSQTRVLHNE